MTTTYEILMEEHGKAASLLAERAAAMLGSPVHASIVDDPAFKIIVVQTFIQLFPEIKDSHRPLVLFESIIALVLAKLEQG